MNSPADPINTWPADASPTDSAPALVDPYGRRVTYLRLSVTDRCDFRCTYCMADKMKFLPHPQVMSFEECERLVRVFTRLGVTKLRITGGEPLVRKGILDLLPRLAALPGLHHLVLTTNGSQLARYAAALRQAGVERLNISLDSLDSERFRRITRTGRLDQVLTGIYAARVAGFARLKLNTVMMRGINDDELFDLADYAVGHGLDISFIEEMPFGAIGGRNSRYISSDETLDRLRQRFQLVVTNENTGGPSRYWQVLGSGSRFGFISPHSHNFCGSCNRVRISACGGLHPCLGDDGLVPLLPLLRDPRIDDEALRQQIVRALGMKAAGHDFSGRLDAPRTLRFMSRTGG